MDGPSTSLTSLDDFVRLASEQRTLLALVHHTNEDEHDDACCVASADVQDRARQLAFTYSELLLTSQRAAVGLLLQCGERSSTIISFCDESPNLIVAFLTIGFAGCVVVPVDPGAPDARLHSLVADCGAAIAVCAAEWTVALAAKRLKVSLQPLDALLAAGAAEGPTQAAALLAAARPDAESALHLIYTSGSTGRPKAVLVTHRAMRAYSFAKASAHGVVSAPDASRVLVASAHTWDPCIGDVYSTLSVGATLCTAPRATIVHALGPTLAALRATHVVATPSLWALLASSPDELPSLRFVALGGEALALALVSPWLRCANAMSGALALANTYGVTEATVYQTVGVLPSGLPRGHGTSSCGIGGVAGAGFALNGVLLALDLSVGDDDDDGVSGPRADRGADTDTHTDGRTNGDGDGEARLGYWLGEVLMGGDQLAVGYHNREALTADRFVMIQGLPPHIKLLSGASTAAPSLASAAALCPTPAATAAAAATTAAAAATSNAAANTNATAATTNAAAATTNAAAATTAAAAATTNAAAATTNAGAAGRRWFRTGDLGSCEASGGLRLHGRRDAQVKLRGQRIELGEIEAVARQSAAVAASAASIVEDQLVLYVVPCPALGALCRSSIDLAGAAHAFTSAGGEAAVRLQLRRWLPVALHPSRVLPIAALPLTAGGKLLRSELPPPPPLKQTGPASGATEDDADKAPFDSLSKLTGPTEHAVAEAWTRALPGTPLVTARSNFFELGGTSVSGARMLAELHALLDPRDGGGTDAFVRGNQRFATRLCGLYRKPRLRDYCVWLQWAAMPAPAADASAEASDADVIGDGAAGRMLGGALGDASGALLAAGDLALPDALALGVYATEALGGAASAGDRALVSELLCARADVEGGVSREERGLTPLMRAARRGGHGTTAGGREGRNASSAGSIMSRNAVGVAAGDDAVEIVATLLAAGASVNAASRTQATALHYAAGAGCERGLALLLGVSSAALLARDMNKSSALHHAARAGSASCTALLLAAHVPSDCVDRWGRTPLCWACAGGHADVAAALLAAGASARGPRRPQAAHLERYSQTQWSPPLHLALRARGPLGLVRQLLASRADAHALDQGGASAVELAHCVLGWTEASDVLRTCEHATPVRARMKTRRHLVAPGKHATAAITERESPGVEVARSTPRQAMWSNLEDPRPSWDWPPRPVEGHAGSGRNGSACRWEWPPGAV